ncbi:MAG TPA: RagB/SusD family nutrient uptake outer membrane protein, partial [Panacibacter sp.]|nr:RagB/SusD family nutrient uptake outer membrane protein [Panacibacter sp.]
LVTSISACNKDFLEIPSETNLTSTTFFKTQADFEKAVNGAYAPLRDLYRSGANSGTGQWLMGEMHSDNSRYILNPNFRATIDQEQVADFIYDAASTAATFKYTTNYLIIARANQILALIDGVDFDAAVKNNLKGQAYFLRALSYFDLVQFYGKVPLHLTPVTSLGETYLPLSSVDSVYDQIIADAEQAAALLPAKSAQQAGRATSGAAKTLLGNAYIVMKDYASAESVLKEVVNSGEYDLLADYASVFNPANKNNMESVFEIQFLEGTEGYASNFIYSFLPQPMTAAETTTLMANYGVAPANIQAISVEAFNVPTPDMIAAYEEGDKREAASIGYGVAGGKTYPFVLKYLHPHTTFGITNDNCPVYRYAEVLLLLAEALNEQGKSSEALTYLNQVRARAGLENIASTEDLQDVIMQERRVELAFENKRWPDLVRTGKAVEVITAYGAKVKANPAAYYYPAGYAPVAAAFTNIQLTFPLPASEALLSPYF